jgi:hypothetical protein
MANIIKPKRSNTAAKVPNTSELTSGELGVNMADRKVYINNGTTVVQVGAGNLSGLGDVAVTSPSNGQSLAYNSTTSKWENSAGGAGTVTSVGITPGTGVTVSGSPITTSGNIAVGLSTKLTAIENLSGAGFFTQNGSGVIAGRTLQAGTGISIAHGNGSSQDPTITNSAPDQTVVLTGAGATSITGTYPSFTISSVNTTYSPATSTVAGLIELGSDTAQTVAANAVSATASRSYALQVNAAGQGVVNVPWTDTNSGGTVTSVAALTLGTTGTDLSSTVANGTTTPVITLNVPTASATNRGVLSAADWTTFNNKTSNTGTVTSVGGTGTVSGLTLTGTVTTSGNLTLGGTLAVTPSNFASQTANTILAAPNGTAGVPTFRALVAADVPTLNQNTTGTAANVTGTVAVANGGTGSTTAAGALTNLGAYAASNPSGYTSNTGTVTSVGTTGTVAGITLTGTVTTSGNLTLGGTFALPNGQVTGKMIYNSFTATAAQTTFTTTNTYTSGKIDVFVNGVKLVNGSDVTVTSGTSVVMASGLPVNTRVDLVYPI